MADREQITGKPLSLLFRELRQDKTLLKMKLLNGDLEHLTQISEIRQRKRNTYILVDYPESFQQILEPSEHRRIRFEFTAKDNIRYVFESEAEKYSQDVIWIQFPESVERFQRRKLFRLDAPHGTRLFFKIDDSQYELWVVNVSLGGSLGVLVSMSENKEKNFKLYDHRLLENVELMFPSESDHEKVKIKQCQIKRQEINPQTNRYECAMEFKEIADDEEKKLTEYFYEHQRKYLKKRSLMKA
ncbi:MAG: PilZ domain-containing protein [Desulfobacterales bacterium]|jgi:c-di-GMP-binding flagellar brake protein YcgR